MIARDNNHIFSILIHCLLQVYPFIHYLSKQPNERKLKEKDFNDKKETEINQIIRHSYTRSIKLIIIFCDRFAVWIYLCTIKMVNCDHCNSLWYMYIMCKTIRKSFSNFSSFNCNFLSCVLTVIFHFFFVLYFTWK